jgi:hypothetical protein
MDYVRGGFAQDDGFGVCGCGCRDDSTQCQESSIDGSAKSADTRNDIVQDLLSPLLLRHQMGQTPRLPCTGYVDFLLLWSAVWVWVHGVIRRSGMHIVLHMRVAPIAVVGAVRGIIFFGGGRIPRPVVVHRSKRWRRHTSGSTIGMMRRVGGPEILSRDQTGTGRPTVRRSRRWWIVTWGRGHTAIRI